MANDSLLKGIQQVEKLASGTRLQRLLHNPLKYIFGMLYRELFYRVTKKEISVLCKTFFRTNMSVFLPSGMDIFLTGGKSHDSETKLARFLMAHLKSGDTFVDIGAHYGYFSLFGSHLVGNAGKVIAVEASPKTYTMLEKNATKTSNLSTYNSIISDESGILNFYIFPNKYAEYNSLDIQQYEGKAWFKSNKPSKVPVRSQTLDILLAQLNVQPTIIKIDVEGAEEKVLKGSLDILETYSPCIVLEYVCASRGNAPHRRALDMLKLMGYKSYTLDKNGITNYQDNIDSYFIENSMESDNIVMKT